jgi:hypothetical protein
MRLFKIIQLDIVLHFDIYSQTLSWDNKRDKDDNCLQF